MPQNQRHPSLSHSTYISSNLHRINPRNIPHNPLPPRHPARRRVIDGNKTLKRLGRAIGHGVGGAAHFEELLAVGAAAFDEFGLGLDEAADQAGAEGARDGGHVDNDRGW